MATFKNIIEEVHALAKKQCCEKDEEDAEFEPLTEEEFEAGKDVDIALLITKEGAWGIGQPTPIIPELSVLFMFRKYGEDGKVDPDADAVVMCIPTSAQTKKGSALSPTRITIPGADIMRMGEGMSIETWREAAAAEIVSLVLGDDEDEPGDPEAVQTQTEVNGTSSLVVGTPPPPVLPVPIVQETPAS